VSRFCTTPRRYAGEGAEHGALAAVEGDAADHRGREHREDHVLALVGADRADVAGLHDAADRGEDARDDEHAEHDAFHAYARRPGRVRVAADCVQGASDPVVPEDQAGDREDDRGEPHRQRHGEEGGGGQGAFPCIAALM
jgi:hypothetical protein